MGKTGSKKAFGYPKSLEKHKNCIGLLICVLVFLALSAVYYSKVPDWDASVFVGMGKFIWSWGHIGLFEPARPILLPLVMGFFWRIGLNTNFAGIILIEILSVLSIYIFNKILGQFFNWKLRLAGTLLFCLNIAFATYSTKTMTDVPAMTLALCAVYYSIKRENFFLSGIIIGLSTITRFTYGIFFPIILVSIFFQKRNNLKNACHYLYGFLIPIVPYLAANQIFFNSPIHSFVEGNKLIGMVVANYTSPKSPLFYVNGLLRAAPITILALAAVLPVLKTRDWRIILVALAFACPLIYHSAFVIFKTARYSLIFLPFAYILTIVGYDYLRKRLNRSGRVVLTAFFMISMVFSAFLAYQNIMQEQRNLPKEYNEFYDFLSGKNVSGQIWSTTPVFASIYDIKISELMYYPVLDDKKINEMQILMNSITPQYIFVDTCNIPCVNYDPDCPIKRDKFLGYINETFKNAFNGQYKDCLLKVYESIGDQ